MALVVRCPHCRAKYNVAEKHLGLRTRCKKCNETFNAGEPPGSKVEPPPLVVEVVEVLDEPQPAPQPPTPRPRRLCRKTRGLSETQIVGLIAAGAVATTVTAAVAAVSDRAAPSVAIPLHNPVG